MFENHLQKKALSYLVITSELSYSKKKIENCIKYYRRVRRERRSAAGRVEASAEEGRRRERVSKASSHRRPSERNVARRGEDGMGRSKAPACWKS